MGFRTDAYAMIWEIENKGKYHNAKISIQKKNPKTGEYEVDFGGFVRMIGTAHNMCVDENIQPKTKIKLGSVDVSNNYDKDKKIMYTNYCVFSFEAQTQQKTESSYAMEVDGESPF